MEICAGFPDFNPNPAPGDDHMHQAEYVFEGDNRLTTHWKSMARGFHDGSPEIQAAVIFFRGYSLCCENVPFCARNRTLKS